MEADAHAGEWHLQVSLLAHTDMEFMPAKSLYEARHRAPPITDYNHLVSLITKWHPVPQGTWHVRTD